MLIYSVLALVCSLLYSVSAVLCKYGLQHNVDIRLLSLHKLFKFLIHNKWWIIGVALSVIANVAMVEIQSRLDVSIVYSLLNFSYIFVLVLGHYFLHEHLNRDQWLGVGTVVLGTLMVLAIEDQVTGQGTNVHNLLVLTFGAVIVTAALIGIAYQYSKRLNYEILYAVCTGICFGCVETYLKATTNLVASDTGGFTIFSLDSVSYFLTVWPFFVTFFFGCIGWVFLQVTYSHGKVSVTIPVVAVTQRIVSMSSGYFIFGEYFTFMRGLGILTIILGVFILIFSTIDIDEPSTV